MSERKYLTITALTKYIKRKFDMDPHLQEIWIKGEISNFKYHSRGHMYFTLKDENARLLAVMFANENKTLPFTPENGMNVLVRGEISVYGPSGNYQIYVRDLQQDGIGNLYLAYEQLKKKLEKEGLFSDAYKKPIPKYPKQIAVITSPTGAAVRDIITTIKRRYPVAKILIIPALVQGPHAPSSIVNAIAKANQIESIDVLIVGRGGGSIEELWAFNDEKVVREIFNSSIPVISAVGHETDFTIADFVADLRAPTPTGAGELSVPHFEELLERLSQRRTRLYRAMNEKVKTDRARVETLQRSYAFRYPKQLHQQKEQQLDRLLELLHKESLRSFEQKRDSLNRLQELFNKSHPKDQLLKAYKDINEVNKKLQKEMNAVLNQKKLLFAASISKLDALSPLKVMERGYGIVYKKGNVVKSVKRVSLSESVQIKLADGLIDCKIQGIEESSIDE